MITLRTLREIRRLDMPLIHGNLWGILTLKLYHPLRNADYVVHPMLVCVSADKAPARNFFKNC